MFSYANVSYRLRSFEEAVRDPKQTVDYQNALAERIDERVAAIGADGKLVLDANGDVYLVNLLEKLLVPLLAKLGNLVLDGGIWLNTQRPEWNDANNALVGHGVSVVTLCYMRRYLRFLQELLAREQETAELSAEVAAWLTDTASALAHIRPWLGQGPVSAGQRWQALEKLGMAARRYRESVYADTPFAGKVRLPIAQVREFLGNALMPVGGLAARSLPARSCGLNKTVKSKSLPARSCGLNKTVKSISFPVVSARCTLCPLGRRYTAEEHNEAPSIGFWSDYCLVCDGRFWHATATDAEDISRRPNIPFLYRVANGSDE